MPNSLIIRKAETKDSQALFRLSNQPSVRNSSFNSGKISLKEHQEWFKEKVNNSSCVYFVAEINNNVVAQLRLDVNNNRSIISVSTDYRHRGQGIGKQIFAKMIKHIRSHCPCVKTIDAYIKQSNPLSLMFFKSLGFNHVGNVIIKRKRAYHYQYDLS
jgi:L-amino acid N-acyltransferase YncA